MELKEKQIDKSIPIPLYYQLKQHLKEYIKHRKDGDSIPTESELCDHFKVSRPTVRQAIAELVREGHLTRSKGKGTFVTSPKVSRDYLYGLRSFNQDLLSRGVTPVTKVLGLSIIPAEESIAEKLKISSQAPVVFLRRLRFADDKSLMIVNSFIPYDRVPGFEKLDLEKMALYEVFETKFQLIPIRAVRELEAISTPEEVATLLGVKVGSPCQYLETLVFTKEEYPIEFATAWYRGDRSKFIFEVSINKNTK